MQYFLHMHLTCFLIEAFNAVSHAVLTAACTFNAVSPAVYTAECTGQSKILDSTEANRERRTENDLEAFDTFLKSFH